MKNINILFFTSFSERSVQIESIIYYFKNAGYNVFFVTTTTKGAIHRELEKNGVNTFTLKQALLFNFLVSTVKLIRFAQKNQIHFIHSHLQKPNLISCIAGLFIKGHVFNVRHNSDVISLDGTLKEKLAEKIINYLSKTIIAISNKVKQQLIQKEKVNPNKIVRINNGYDFNEYEKLSLSSTEYITIKKKYVCEHFLISPGRLIPTKRHLIAINGIKKLIEKGFDVKLLILGSGPLLEKLKNHIKSLDLTAHVFIEEYKENISDFIKAADSIILLSESEASNNVIKEAGYFSKPVIVCENVGDFDDYIKHKQNGLLVSKDNPLPGFLNAVEYLYYFPGEKINLGKSLHTKVIEEFDIKKIGRLYEKLQESFHTGV